MWAATGPAALLDALTPLARLRGRTDEVRLIVGSAEPGGVGQALDARPDALLVLEPPDGPSARNAVDGPLSGGTAIGWLALDTSGVAAYADRAVALESRGVEPAAPLILLGPREPRYAELLDDVAEAAGGATIRWSAERIGREPMLEALRAGPAAVLYVGHGAREGWHGYGGVAGEAFAQRCWDDAERIAVMVSLSCATGERGGFADRLVGAGAAMAVLAPVALSLHTDTRRLAPALAAAAVRSPGTRLADLLRDVTRTGAPLHHYAVIGDPTIPLRAALGLIHRCEAVFAPAPEYRFE